MQLRLKTFMQVRLETIMQALMLAVVALKQPAIECLILCNLRGLNGVTLSNWYSVCGLSDRKIGELILNKKTSL